MTLAYLITLNLILSLVAILGVAGFVSLAARLRSRAPLDTDWRMWADPLPLSLLEGERPASLAPERPAYREAA